MNVIKKYWDSVYIYILLIVPVLCICAGVFWTVCKLAGLYPKLSWTSIGIFDGSQLIYLGVSLYFIYCNKKDGSYIQTHLSEVKLFICTILLIQYAFILVLFPSYEVWGCTFIFFAAIVFLFDTKITVISLSGYMVSLLLAHLLHPYEFLPIGKDNLGEMIAFRIVALSLTAICVVLVVHFAETFLMEATENNEENMSLLEQQVEHYKRIEVLDTELRKFRHDICNHFICMEAYLEQDKKQELQAYFKDLRQSFSFQERIYFSGNDIIDAVLNYQLSQELKEQVKVRVYGILPDKLAVSDMDLCTIFSNLLSNAIHSANQCVGERDSKLEIGFAAGKRYFSLIIANSICEKIEQPKRKERSRKNHGFGLYKIQEVLRKYDGRIECSNTEHLVTITVYLPIE